MKFLLRKRVPLDFLVRRNGLPLLVAFGLLGVWVLDDYSISIDTDIQRSLVFKNLDYVLGNNEAILQDHNKFYGLAFELPLVLIEFALGLDDNRDIYLMRHLVTHLFFLAGGFFCYLLAYRLFGSRMLAALAMLLFLLHPRIYVHSFVNSKDAPFLSMFMICLYLAHRAFDRDSGWWWFALFGVGVGLLINLRIMGVVLLVAVLAMQLSDLIRVPDGMDRRHVLTNVTVFVLSSLLTVYATLPFLWNDPIGNGVEWFASSSSHPHNDSQLFRGEWLESRDYHPPEYVSVWFAITTPPVVLVLGMIGISVLALRGFAAPIDVFRDTQLRFWFMLVGCFAIPILAVMVLSANVYNGWRQMYFLYAPFCLLSVFGIHCIFSFFGSLRLKVLAYGAVGAGILAVVVSMVSIHPNQHVYFTFLVDRTTPEHLSDSYDLDYQMHSVIHGSEYLLDNYPSSSIHVSTRLWGIQRLHRFLPEEDRHRLFLWSEYGDFSISDAYRSEFEGDEIYLLKIYNNAIVSVRDLSSETDVAEGDSRSRIYLDAISSGNLVIDSDWDVYLMDGYLVYVKESCSVGDTNDGFFLHLNPVDISDLPEERKEFGFDNLDFGFHFLSDGGDGDIWDGKCFRSVDLPDYPVARISTGQFVAFEGHVWRGVWTPRVSDVYDVFREFHKSSVQPAVDSVFDVYLYEGRMVYVKSQCATEEQDTRFFLHLVPADVSDLPEERKEYGFDNMDFDLWDRGGELDGECFAVVDLPAYEIAGIFTGQYTPEGHVWSEEIDVGVE